MRIILCDFIMTYISYIKPTRVILDLYDLALGLGAYKSYITLVTLYNYYICRKFYQQKPKPLIPSTIPELPWQKVGTDLFEWKGKTYLIIVDYFSRFIEIAKLNQSTAAEGLRVFLQDMVYRKQ